MRRGLHLLGVDSEKKAADYSPYIEAGGVLVKSIIEAVKSTPPPPPPTPPPPPPPPKSNTVWYVAGGAVVVAVVGALLWRSRG